MNIKFTALEITHSTKSWIIEIPEGVSEAEVLGFIERCIERQNLTDRSNIDETIYRFNSILKRDYPEIEGKVKTLATDTFDEAHCEQLEIEEWEETTARDFEEYFEGINVDDDDEDEDDEDENEDDDDEE